MIECAIFAIGEELLEGSVADTNSAFIASALSEGGISPRRIELLPDDGEVITDALKKAMADFPLVLTTGGLGPTFDDLTPDAVAAACGKGLTLYKEVAEHVAVRLARFGVTADDNHLHQAMLPAEALLFPNRHGTAYGFGVETRGSLVISMPGVPAEMKPMLTEQVFPFLKERFNPRSTYRDTLRFGNLPESDLDSVVRAVGIPADVRCIINASSGEVLLKVRSENFDSGKRFTDEVRKHFPKNFIGGGGQTLAEILVELLRKKGMSLSVAESCTGGLLGGAVTSVSGSSDVFQGGVISYSNEVKVSLLGVSEDILNMYGAVSEECALAMSEGAQRLLGTDCSISVTGIAGPDGGTSEKPVGTVWLGLRVGSHTQAKKLLAAGGREDVRARSVRSAVISMIQMLNSED